MLKQPNRIYLRKRRDLEKGPLGLSVYGGENAEDGTEVSTTRTIEEGDKSRNGSIGEEASMLWRRVEKPQANSKRKFRLRAFLGFTDGESRCDGVSNIPIFLVLLVLPWVRMIPFLSTGFEGDSWFLTVLPHAAICFALGIGFVIRHIPTCGVPKGRYNVTILLLGTVMFIMAVFFVMLGLRADEGDLSWDGSTIALIILPVVAIILSLLAFGAVCCSRLNSEKCWLCTMDSLFEIPSDFLPLIARDVGILLFILFGCLPILKAIEPIPLFKQDSWLLTMLPIAILCLDGTFRSFLYFIRRPRKCILILLFLCPAISVLLISLALDGYLPWNFELVLSLILIDVSFLLTLFLVLVRCIRPHRVRTPGKKVNEDDPSTVSLIGDKGKGGQDLEAENGADKGKKDGPSAGVNLTGDGGDKDKRDLVVENGANHGAGDDDDEYDDEDSYTDGGSDDNGSDYDPKDSGDSSDSEYD
jgi:hypothetical protein